MDTLFWIASWPCLFNLRISQFRELLKHLISPEWLIYLVAGYSVFSIVMNFRQ